MWALLVAAVVSGCQAALLLTNSTANGTDLSIGGGIVGLFDTITGITKGVGGLFGQFEDGFEKIQPVSESANNITETKVAESNITNTETHETESETPGSSIIVGLFKTLKDLTKDVGKLVGVVEEELTNRREDVVELAEQVEDEVEDLGDAIKNWVGSLEDGVKNITWSLNHTTADGEVVQVANYTSWIKISSVEDDETEEEVLVEDIPIIE
jgi:hypothetical protein